MTRYRTANAMKGMASSAVGYLIALGLGAAAGPVADGEGSADPGAIALTLLVIAPLGAFTGAALALHLFGETRRKRLTWRWLASALVIVALVGVGPGFPEGTTWLILGLAILVVARTGMGPYHVVELQPGPIRRAHAPANWD